MPSSKNLKDAVIKNLKYAVINAVIVISNSFFIIILIKFMRKVPCWFPSQPWEELWGTGWGRSLISSKTKCWVPALKLKIWGFLKLVKSFEIRFFTTHFKSLCNPDWSQLWRLFKTWRREKSPTLFERLRVSEQRSRILEARWAV